MKQKTDITIHAAFIFFFCFSYASCKVTQSLSNKAYTIRVLLAEYNLENNATFAIVSPNGIHIKRENQPNSSVFFPSQCLTIEIKQNKIFLTERTKNYRRTIASTIFLFSRDKYLSFGGNKFAGALRVHIKRKEKKLLLINYLDLEEYLYSVLRYELFQSWPIALHKVQAIASRSYAISCMMKARNQAKPYDIKRTNFHQTYHGTHPHTHLIQAIEETRGKVLTFDGKVITAMFDACCGGVIPRDIAHHDYTQTPYLARCTPCTYCKGCKLYRWKKEISLEMFKNHLNVYEPFGRNLNKLDGIFALNVHETDEAGIVQSIRFQGKNRALILKGQKLQKCLRSLFRSLCFSIKQIAGIMEIQAEGKGFGHLTGLCQYGARELVRRDWSVNTILQFYYPKTVLAQLC